MIVRMVETPAPIYPTRFLDNSETQEFVALNFESSLRSSFKAIAQSPFPAAATSAHLATHLASLRSSYDRESAQHNWSLAGGKGAMSDRSTLAEHLQLLGLPAA